MSFKFFGDESRSSGVFALGGFLATVSAWDHLSAQWEEVLDRAGLRGVDGSLLPFHMTDFESRFGAFAGWSDEKRVGVIGDLIDIINGAINSALIVRLDRGLARQTMTFLARVRPGSQVDRMADYLTGFYVLMTFLFEFLKRTPEIPRVPVIFDLNDECVGGAVGILGGLIKSVPGFEKIIGPLLFDSKKQLPPLQAADIMVYESMKHLDNKLKGSARGLRKSFSRLEKSRYFVVDCQREDLEKLDADLTEEWLMTLHDDWRAAHPEDYE